MARSVVAFVNLLTITKAPTRISEQNQLGQTLLLNGPNPTFGKMSHVLFSMT